MCYSFEASVSAGFFSYLTAFILIARNYEYDRWFALFILSFSSIQWAEAILWKNLNNLRINHIVTRWVIPIILASQGLAGLIGANIYHDVDIYLWVTYIFIALIIIFFNSRNNLTTIVDGSLFWGKDPNQEKNLLKEEDKDESTSFLKYLPHILFAIYIALPFYLYMDDGLNKTVMILGIFGLLVYAIINNNKTVSSNWCFYANLLSLFALIRPYI